jgi:D-serine deaminase-like pyridoxal phosphate-dependent protein
LSRAPRCASRTKKDEIVMMAKLAESLPNVEFRGLMGYDGHAQGNTDTRVQQTQDSSSRLSDAKAWVEAAGLEVPLLSGAGSGNYWEALKGSTNEIQAGGGVLFCMNYAESHDVDAQRGKFQHALKMQIQIISTAGQSDTRV